jgi:hypothetical protein
MRRAPAAGTGYDSSPDCASPSASLAAMSFDSPPHSRASSIRFMHSGTTADDHRSFKSGSSVTAQASRTSSVPSARPWALPTANHAVSVASLAAKLEKDGVLWAWQQLQGTDGRLRKPPDVCHELQSAAKEYASSRDRKTETMEAERDDMPCTPATPQHSELDELSIGPWRQTSPPTFPDTITRMQQTTLKDEMESHHEDASATTSEVMHRRAMQPGVRGSNDFGYKSSRPVTRQAVQTKKMAQVRIHMARRRIADRQHGMVPS